LAILVISKKQYWLLFLQFVAAGLACTVLLTSQTGLCNEYAPASVRALFYYLINQVSALSKTFASTFDSSLTSPGQVAGNDEFSGFGLLGRESAEAETWANFVGFPHHKPTKQRRMTSMTDNTNDTAKTPSTVTPTPGGRDPAVASAPAHPASGDSKCPLTEAKEVATRRAHAELGDAAQKIATAQATDKRSCVSVTIATAVTENGETSSNEIDYGVTIGVKSKKFKVEDCGCK
jgi:hypothetical protein